MSNVSGRIWEIHLLQLVGKRLFVSFDLVTEKFNNYLAVRTLKDYFHFIPPPCVLEQVDSTQICMFLHVCTQF